jgi:superfamily II DNA/RNA helicase
MRPLLQHVNSNEPGIWIVYCRTINVLDKIVGYLRKNVSTSQRRSVRPFHSDLSVKYKDKTLEMLKAADTLKVIVATDALGMVNLSPLLVL